MIKENLENNAVRVKRPRIQHATVPGEFEKVDVRYEIMSIKKDKAKPVRVGEKLTYSIALAQNLKPL